MRLIVLLLLLASAMLAVAWWRRRQAPTEQPPPRRPTSSMSRSEALKILGLEGMPEADAVITAHRRLMQGVHPDRGGSTYLAQQLNEAKRVLLSTRAQ